MKVEIFVEIAMNADIINNTTTMNADKENQMTLNGDNKPRWPEGGKGEGEGRTSLVDSDGVWVAGLQ